MTPAELSSENPPPRAGEKTEIEKTEIENTEIENTEIEKTELGGEALAAHLEHAARRLSARLARQTDLTQHQETEPQTTELKTTELKTTEPQAAQRKLPKPEYSGFGTAREEFADDVFEDDEAALRWRHALLRLSETFLDAAEERRNLSPILLGALHNALEQLLIHGEEADLMALEDWLSHEGDAAASTPEGGEERRTADFLMAGENAIYNGEERRIGNDRRSPEQRRQAERRG